MAYDINESLYEKVNHMWVFLFFGGFILFFLYVCLAFF